MNDEQLPPLKNEEPTIIQAPKTLPTPMDFLQRMFEMNTDPEHLRQAMDLYERWRKDIAAEAYARDMSMCQGQMRGLPRTKQGQHHRYNPYDEMDEIIRPIYTTWGFSLSFTEDPARSTPDAMWYICRCRHKKGHVEVAEGLFPRDGEGSQGNRSGMNRLQACGSNRSYQKRYLAKDIFALAEKDEDNDGASANETITEAEIAYVKQLLRERDVDYDKFLAYVCDGMDKSLWAVENMPRRVYPAALAMLKKKPLRKEANGAKA